MKSNQKLKGRYSLAKREKGKAGHDVDIFESADLDTIQQMLGEARDEPADPVESGRVVPTTELPSDQAEQIAECTVGDCGEVGGGPLEGKGAPAVERTNEQIKIRVTRSTRAAFDLFRAELSSALGGTRLTDANIGRALLEWVLHEAKDEIVSSARQQPGLHRPASDDLAAMERFDQTLRDVARSGIEEAVSRRSRLT